MKKVLLILTTIAGSAILAGTAQAQWSPAGSCSDVHWTADFLKKYPDIAQSCVGVVERNGVRYIRLSGKVTSRSKDSITVRLDKTKHEMTWKPAADEKVTIDGKDVPATDVAVDQELRFYLPEEQVATAGGKM